MSDDWRRFAACKGYSPEYFHAKRTENKARFICNTQCVVRQSCLEWALEVEADMALTDIFGVYGGQTAEQRKLTIRRAPGWTPKRTVIAEPRRTNVIPLTWVRLTGKKGRAQREAWAREAEGRG